MNSRRELARLTAVLACIVAGVAAASCGDRATQPVAPERGAQSFGGPRGVDGFAPGDTIYVDSTVVPDSVKESAIIEALQASMARSSARANSSALADAASASYFVFAVPFTPEAEPSADPLKGHDGPICDDCVMHNVPLGFSFTYFGRTYSTVEIGSNGFIGLDGGAGEFVDNGCCNGPSLPTGPNPTTQSPNIIALAWTDWNPKLGGTIRYESRGEPGHRQFILQYSAIQEFKKSGRLTAQLVLNEGSNEITMYTTEQSSTSHLVTQGIQDLTGTQAVFWPGRSAAQYTLANNAVRFSPAALAISAPGDLTVSTDAGMCSASVAPGMATANHEAAVSGARSDALALAAAYPKGSTSIVWTATDAQPTPMSVSASQNILVKDLEAPVIAAAANLAANATSAAGASLAVSAPTASDNCAGVVVNGRRSDGAALDAAYPAGATTISWVATDAAGNTASSLQQVLVTAMDNIPPMLHLPGDMTVNATTPAGAVVTYAASATDNMGTPTLSCSPLSGSVFAIGSRSVSCIAQDGAGNNATGGFNVMVLGAPEQIVNLINSVRKFPLTATQQTQLITLLQKALQKPQTTASVCSTLTKVAMAVKGVPAKTLSVEKAAQVIADLTRIRAVIGCQ